MASCVGQTQGAHHLRLGSRRLRTDGVVDCPCATDEFSHTKGIRVSGASAPRPAAGTGSLYNQSSLGVPCIKENEMKRMVAVVRRPVICLLAMMGGAVLSPTVCSAEDFDRFSFPLPLPLEVGDGWTYSIVKTHWKAKDQPVSGRQILDTLSAETLTIRVVERLQIEDQTYFALSDGGLYRVDEASRTWRYDTEAKSEMIVWDIWGPIVWVIWAQDWQIPRIEKAVVDGYACEYNCLSRFGPFVRHVVPIPDHPEFEEADIWIATIDVYTLRLERFLYYSPFVWAYTDIIKFPNWGITELYLFEDTPDTTADEQNRTIVVAPNVGVVYYAFAKYFYSIYSDQGESMADSTGSGKVGFVNILSSGFPIDYIEKTEWILQDVQTGALESTSVEDISFGQLKQRMTRPALDDP